MCGRFYLEDNPAFHALCAQLHIDATQWPIRFKADISPASTISIIREVDGDRRIDDAIWWLLLQASNGGWKPNYKYATFNTRYDKLNKPRSAGYKAFRESRCVIPATGFVEGLEGTKTYHQLEGDRIAIAFGGLCREWYSRETEETTYSASIITLPPHQRFQAIHEKAFPMMLDLNDQATTDMWLDRDFKTVEAFESLLIPKIVTPLKTNLIDRPSKRNPTGDAFTLEADPPDGA